MKSAINKSAVILILAAFLFWSIGCSTSGNILNSKGAESTTVEAESAGTDRWANAALVVGGFAAMAGGFLYFAPKIAAATQFLSETGDLAPFFRLPGFYK